MSDTNNTAAVDATAATAAVARTRTPSLTTERAKQLVEETTANGVLTLDKNGKAVLTVFVPGIDAVPASEGVEAVAGSEARYIKYPLDAFIGVTQNMVDKAETALDPLAESRKRMASAIAGLKESGLTAAQIQALFKANL